MFSRRPGLKTIVAAAALLTVAACGGDDSEPEGSATGDGGAAEEEQADDQEPVTITFTWWGDDNRADLYEQSLALFAEEYPHITVNPNFSAWDDYWPARATEAAGGALPDVMQMDLSYIRQYAAPGQLLALDDYVEDQIDLSGFEDTLLPVAFGGDEGQLISIAEGVGKMKAALAGRQDPRLVIVGRTSAIGITGVDDTIARLKAYEAAGVDMLFMAGLKNRSFDSPMTP